MFLLQAVKQSVLFQHLDEAVMLRIVKVMQLQEVQAGAAIIHENEEGHTFYVIEEGEFDIYKVL